MANPEARQDQVEITLLRPLWWLRAAGWQPGRVVGLDLAEMGLSGPARVVSVEACPQVAGGPGRVVLGTVTHLNDELVRLELEGEPEPLGATATPRLYSEDRRAWVSAEDLKAGERLRTRQGPRRQVFV